MEDLGKMFSDEDNDFRFIEHNETNYKAFRESERKQRELARKSIEEFQRAARIFALKKWENSLPHRWKKAVLQNIENPAANKALKIIKKHGYGSFFVKGEPGSGKTYLSYAILRRYIGLGYIVPSEIKIISETTLLSFASAGFEGWNRFEKLFNNQYKIYLFDDVSSPEFYSKREISIWEQMIDHIYTNSLSAIFTSSHSAKHFSEILSESSSSKFRQMVSGRIITMGQSIVGELDDSTDEELADKANSQNEQMKLAQFD